MIHRYQGGNIYYSASMRQLLIYHYFLLLSLDIQKKKNGHRSHKANLNDHVIYSSRAQTGRGEGRNKKRNRKINKERKKRRGKETGMEGRRKEH